MNDLPKKDYKRVSVRDKPETFTSSYDLFPLYLCVWDCEIKLYIV